MTKGRICLYSFLVTLIVWGWFSWPLPRYFFSGIPAAAHLEPAEVQPLIPGDHLQFMYYCWLAGDMLAGKTPLFCNLYEFNTDGERSGYRPDAYYFPFSLVYAFSSFAFGRAFGWNLTGFISLWLTLFLTWLLVRRYTGGGESESGFELAAGCAALVAIMLPFRWINLCGGSPAGFAMLWVPAILLGVDAAVRDARPAGGILAGVALLFASWTDNHVFFFGALAAPGWGAVACVAGLNGGRKWREDWQAIFAALLPIPIFAAAALAFPAFMQMMAGSGAGQHLASSVGARWLREVALFSPAAEGFLGWFTAGASAHIYVGVSMAAFVAAGLLALAFQCIRRPGVHWRRLAVLVLLLAGMGVIMALALGTNGPHHALFLRACRKLIPPYAMIRQPAKIFCLMPAILAVASGISLAAVFARFKTRPAMVLAALVFCAAVGAEYSLRVNPTVSLLDSEQGAYAAVAEEAAAEGRAPHALVVPLWPGDSHYSSVYQHYASLYRVRMVNGYNPFVSDTYKKNVFFPYESVNQGWLTDKQIDSLLEMKVEYLILHEDLFPEKVSPFPVGFALKQFLDHKRLRLLKHDGRVWAFKMLPEPKNEDKFQLSNTKSQISTNYPIAANEKGKPGYKETGADTWKTFGCARRWQAEGLARGKAKSVRSLPPYYDARALLDEPGAAVILPSLRVAPAPGLRFMARVKGEGAVVAELSANEKIISRDLVDVSSEDWEWADIPADKFSEYAPLGLRLELESGLVECDQIILSANEWIPPAPGRTLDLPAPAMFHAGYTSLPDNTVVLEKEREAKALVFYGPKLPLEKGRYRVELLFSSGSPRGTMLGQFNIKRHDREEVLNWVPVMSGARSLEEFTQLQNVPMHLEFRFLGNIDIRIGGIRFTRIK
ncbi:MAG: hypothetical protein WC299_02360 [Kiritimatiellia bacterium]